MEAEGTTIRLEQVKLDGMRLRDDKGTEGPPERPSSLGFRRLRATSPLLRDFALSTEGNLVGACVLASGRAHPIVQSEDATEPRFFVELSALEPCEGEGRDFTMPATRWEVRRELAELSHRHTDAHGPEARVFYAAARHVDRGFLAHVGRTAAAWEGTMTSIGGAKGEPLSFVMRLGGPAEDEARLVPYELCGSVPPLPRRLYEDAASVRDGDCVRVWGSVSLDESSFTESGAMMAPRHGIALTRIERCGVVGEEPSE